ncbi:hypothetical protein GBA65_15035 [Rubrobacter marinus]|uniref:Peptidase C39-like domain-containing protein n=1 Tax=Rubrobacter marinus TaxID=2653852 RepID=A0A6G8PZF5_9ACTN|nr:hypothetical protein [Rubrobacter marinus]QIN79619.1 hypothetical protein GBA65_15035 [Rubrobacter marinus]
MIPVAQTRSGGPDAPREEAGNCYAACVASILELALEDVPDVAPNDNGEDGWNEAWGGWFRERGLTTYNLVRGEGDDRPFEGYTIGTVPSRNGPYEHAVVCRDGEVVWDPNPANAEKPYDSSEATSWEVFALLDASELVKRRGR